MFVAYANSNMGQTVYVLHGVIFSTTQKRGKMFLLENTYGSHSTVSLTPHKVHPTAINKQPKFYTSKSPEWTREKSLLDSFPEIRGSTPSQALARLQYICSPMSHPIVHVCNGGAINNLVCHCFA